MALRELEVLVAGLSCPCPIRSPVRTIVPSAWVALLKSSITHGHTQTVNDAWLFLQASTSRFWKRPWRMTQRKEKNALGAIYPGI